MSAGMPDRLRGSQKDVPFMSELLVYPKPAKDVRVLGSNAGQEDRDPAAFQLLDRVSQDRCSSGIKRRDSRHAKHDDSDLAELGQLEQEGVSRTEEEGPV